VYDSPPSLTIRIAQLCILLLASMVGSALSWFLYKKWLYTRHVVIWLPTLMLVLSGTFVSVWGKCESSSWFWIVVLGVLILINVPGLAAVLLLNAVASQWLIPPFSYVAFAVTFWLGWHGFGRLVLWRSKCTSKRKGQFHKWPNQSA
jgi:hypothetical protein